MNECPMKWQTKEGFIKLLDDLVEIPSISGSEDEVAIAHFIKEQLQAIPYFQEHPSYMQIHPTGDGRISISALVKNGTTPNTVVLVSHFDVVNVEDYGKYKSLAFKPEQLTKEFYKHKDVLPANVQRDIEKGEWRFGRGVMDMKCGIALQMMMTERAAYGRMEGNVLFLVVADEEVNSRGMITSVPALLKIKEEHNLNYHACVNCEPMFARYPGDEQDYIYTGSLGKIMPAFFCYGKESHVGEPFAGLNANSMMSFVTTELELNTEFCEWVDGEVSPPPSTLMQKDLRMGYSVQTPHKAVALYNLFLMERPLEEITENLLNLAKRAGHSIESWFEKRAKQYAAMKDYQSLSLNVLQFEELLQYAKDTYGNERIVKLQKEVLDRQGEIGDEREVAIAFVDKVASLCSEKAPMILLFFAPPYYPAVSTRHNEKIAKVKEDIIVMAMKQYEINMKEQLYFGGISDLSYTGLVQSSSSLAKLIGNMPLWGSLYSLPLKELQQLQLPVLNIGPRGKDAHKWTERLDVDYATGPLQNMLQTAIEKLLE